MVMFGNRRGQEGITLTTLLLIVLGVIVVVVIILGATGGLNFVFDKINIVPGQSLESVRQSCGLAGKNELKFDYCREFKEIEVDGQKQFVTCSSKLISDTLAADEIYASCGDELSVEKVAVAFCNNKGVKASEWDKVKVNGQTCKELESSGAKNPYIKPETTS